MKLGNKLLELRNKKGLTEEEVAKKLGVTKQTVIKWEKGEKTLEFDQIMPICELYGIKSDELLKESVEESEFFDTSENRIKRTRGIVFGIFMFFIALAFIIMAGALNINDDINIGIFILLVGVGVSSIVYSTVLYKVSRQKRKSSSYKIIDELLGLITLVVYLFVSFLTSAWHITWLIWIVYIIIMKVVKLVFTIKGVDYEE